MRSKLLIKLQVLTIAPKVDMKTLLTHLVFILLVGTVINPSQAQQKEKLSPAEKKARRQAEAAAGREVNLELARTRQFVLEAGTVQDRRGQSYIMNPVLNFIIIDGDQSTIQLDFGALIGWNGVGGVTFDGQISQYEIKEGKPTQSFTVNVRSRGAVQGSVDLSFSIGSTSENIRCTARGTWGERLTLSGRMVPLQESKVYKGTSFK